MGLVSAQYPHSKDEVAEDYVLFFFFFFSGEEAPTSKAETGGLDL